MMARRLKPFLLTLFILASFPALYADANFFSNPGLYSPEKLTEELKKKTLLNMCWYFGGDRHFRFLAKNDEVYFEFYLGDLPDGFVASHKDRFIEIADTKQLAFSYKLDKHGNEEINVLQKTPQENNPDTYSYIVSDRRIIENASPLHLNESALEAIIRNNEILFYTGAGLSIASDIPDMSELEKLLGLKAGFQVFLEKALNHPNELASEIEVFYKACLFSAPTKAHFALKDLAVFKNIRIITENLDCLHERSGIEPYRIDAKQLRDEIGGECLSQFDYIICIGLSRDDRGFLGWYKEQNPEGKIIAVDLKQPTYLGDEDFLVPGDLQEVFPSVQKNISSESTYP